MSGSGWVLTIRIFSTNCTNWDDNVPDTLRYVPVNGWKEIPDGFGRDE
jgi:hypothetical protein